MEQNFDDTWHELASRFFERIRAKIWKEKKEKHPSVFSNFEEGSTEFVLGACLAVLVSRSSTVDGCVIMLTHEPPIQSTSKTNAHFTEED